MPELIGSRFRVQGSGIGVQRLQEIESEHDIDLGQVLSEITWKGPRLPCAASASIAMPEVDRTAGMPGTSANHPSKSALHGKRIRGDKWPQNFSQPGVFIALVVSIFNNLNYRRQLFN